MELKFQVYTQIQKPISEVFDAVYNPRKLEGYFTTKFASGPLDEGTTVFWDFADFPTEDGKGFPVKVIECKKNEQIIFEWEANEPQEIEKGLHYNTRVIMTFEELSPNETKVSIAESGWKETPTGLKAAFGNCSGWMQMASCLKAYLEYGINLRKGFFK